MENLLELRVVSQTYGKRPSQILGIDDPWAAYQIDVAALYGTPDNVEKARSVARLRERQAGKVEAGKVSDTQFKPLLQDPMFSSKVRRVKIPESGIWK